MQTKPRLDYLFEADFVDGTTYQQGASDESLNYEKDENGNGPSAYKDILDRLEDVTRFHLVGKDRYTVDLTDGHFEVNGVPFNIERPDVPLTDITLTFFRYTNVSSTSEATFQKGGFWGRLKEVSREHYVSRYAIGYTAKQGAKDVSYSIAIKGEN